MWREPRLDFLRQMFKCMTGKRHRCICGHSSPCKRRQTMSSLRATVQLTHTDVFCRRIKLPFMNSAFNGTTNCVFQDDNASPDRAAAVRELKEQMQIRKLQWSSHSPDMNPIEHVWSASRRTITAGNPPENLTQPPRRLVDAWTQLPQDSIQRLILGMPRRVSPFF